MAGRGQRGPPFPGSGNPYAPHGNFNYDGARGQIVHGGTMQARDFCPRPLGPFGRRGGAVAPFDPTS